MHLFPRVAVLAALLGVAAFAQDAPIRTVAAIPATVQVERDLEYLGPDRKEKADLYRPASLLAGARLPAVLIIHGGGFTGGSKGAAREINIGTNLALHGYVALSVDYVLSTASGHRTWPQNLQDCKSAVRWLRKNAARLSVNPDRIGVIGGSAGGTLAALVTLTRPRDGLEPEGESSTAVRCGVDLYGPGDFTTRDNLQMLGKSRAEAPELYRQASPITYVRRNAPPLLLLHGTADTTVPVAQSEQLAAAMLAAGAPHELVIIPDAPHTFDLQPKQRDLRKLVLGFFDRHLAPGPPR